MGDSRSLAYLKRFRGLSRDDRRLLIAAYVSLFITDLALRTVGFQRLMKRIEHMKPSATSTGRLPNSGKLKRAYRYARWLDVASRHHFVRARCLHRSIALHYWLRRKALPSELHVGVRKEGDQLQAHAWVESDGYLVNDRAVSVAPFAVLSSPISTETGLPVSALFTGGGRHMIGSESSRQ